MYREEIKCLMNEIVHNCLTNCKKKFSYQLLEKIGIEEKTVNKFELRRQKKNGFEFFNLMRVDCIQMVSRVFFFFFEKENYSSFYYQSVLSIFQFLLQYFIRFNFYVIFYCRLEVQIVFYLFTVDLKTIDFHALIISS